MVCKDNILQRRLLVMEPEISPVQTGILPVDNDLTGSLIGLLDPLARGAEISGCLNPIREKTFGELIGQENFGLAKFYWSIERYCRPTPQIKAFLIAGGQFRRVISRAANEERFSLVLSPRVDRYCRPTIDADTDPSLKPWKLLAQTGDQFPEGSRKRHCHPNTFALIFETLRGQDNSMQAPTVKIDTLHIEFID